MKSEQNGTEAARMEALRRYEILDTPPDGAFDRLTALAARLCATPMSVVSIVDTDRIWFKSRYGVDVTEIGRDPGLCASAILQDGPWIVEDARHDPRTLANPLVAGEFGLQFYLGVPLITADGHGIGTLCVLDREPRAVTEQHVADLSDLAAIVVDEMELRLSALKRLSAERDAREQSEDLAQVLQSNLLPASPPEVDGLDLSVRYVAADRGRVGGDFYDVRVTQDSETVLLIGDVEGHGPYAAAATSLARETMLALAEAAWSPARSLGSLNRAMRIRQTQQTEDRYCTIAAVRLTPGGGAWSATVSLGGHPQPVLVHGDGSVETFGTYGSMLGCLDEPVFHDDTVSLRPGDCVVLYTDGLTDACPGVPNLEDGSLQSLLSRVADRSAEVIADALLEAVHLKTSTPRDDIAILVARVLRPSSASA